MRKSMQNLPKNINKLDLGDTKHGEGSRLKRGWASICLDGDSFPYKFKGDYIKTSFPSDHFKEAYGSCFFEFDTARSNQKKRLQLAELFRILKPGGVATLSSCEIYGCIDTVLQHYADLAEQVGFVIDRKKWKQLTSRHAAIYGDIPKLTLIKPK